jgi:predicted transcriptional regulator of viral defense system
MIRLYIYGVIDTSLTQKMKDKGKTINIVEIKGLSKREVQIIASLEFNQKYFFTKEDIKDFFSNKNTLYRGIQKLLAKKRIIKINQKKYYLIPIKARLGVWTEDDYIVVDEICNSGEYYIGGWASANYWRLTDQIPFWIDVFTTNKRGRKRILNKGIIFHQIRKVDKSKYIIKNIQDHEFKILSRKESKKWLKLRQYML